MPKGRKLTLWNGRGDYRGPDHYFVAAYSRQDAVDLVTQAGHRRMTLSELDRYWSKGCWGNAMDGITPERGVWAEDRQFSGKVRRIL